MALLTVPRSHNLLASFVCATALACGGETGEHPHPNGGGLGAVDAGVGGGADAQVLPGQIMQPGATDASVGAPVTGDTGTGTPKPVVDAGPADLGQNSQGDTFFRVDTLVVKAPKIYGNVLFIGQTDVSTDAQNAVNDYITKDSDANGFIDISLLLRFLKTTNPKGANGQVTPGGGECPAPLSPDAACGPEQTFPFQSPALSFANAAQPCPLQGTQDTAAAPCFGTTPASLTLQLPILGALPLEDGQVIGTWDGANISNGVVRGFLLKSVAAATKLGPGLPSLLAVAGFEENKPLTNFLSANEMQKNARGEDGWWFQLGFTAKPAKFNASAKAP